jgi:hypothetical protein
MPGFSDCKGSGCHGAGEKFLNKVFICTGMYSTVVKSEIKNVNFCFEFKTCRLLRFAFNFFYKSRLKLLALNG